MVNFGKKRVVARVFWDYDIYKYMDKGDSYEENLFYVINNFNDWIGRMLFKN